MKWHLVLNCKKNVCKVMRKNIYNKNETGKTQCSDSEQT